MRHRKAYFRRTKPETEDASPIGDNPHQVDILSNFKNEFMDIAVIAFMPATTAGTTREIVTEGIRDRGNS